MRKLLFLFPLFFFLLFFGPPKTHAQTTAPSDMPQGANQHWVCLDVKYCAGDNPYPCYTKNWHEVHLQSMQTANTADKPFANTPTYIVECLATDTSQICTTGDGQLDQKLFGTNNAAALNTALGYRHVGIWTVDHKVNATQPLIADSTGNITPVFWESVTTNEHYRKFLAVNFFNSFPSAGNPGNDTSQKQGTMDPITAAGNCSAIRWDPYGTVFNSKTLEPLSGVTVTLLMQRADGTFSPVSPTEVVGAFNNPVTTLANGGFSFVVPDGTYKLTANLPGYTFPPNLQTINRNFSRIYSQLYPTSPNDVIVQKGAIQHRDMPLDPAGGAGTQNNPPKLMEYFYNADPINQEVIVQGLVSHPFTKLTFYSLHADGSRYNLLKTIQADKFGKFQTTIDESKFAKDEVFGEVELTKGNLSTMASTTHTIWNKVVAFVSGHAIPVVTAAENTSVFRFTPIPTYLEGVAVGPQGQVLANSKVAVYLNFANKPYATTMTDANGHYSISSEYLPTQPYKVMYTTNSGVSYNADLTKLLASNTSTTSPYEFKNAKGVVVNTATQNGSGSMNGGAQNGGPSTGTQTPSVVAGSNSSNPMLKIILLTLVAFSVIIAAVAVWIIRKNK